jgi:hypothetical protein
MKKLTGILLIMLAAGNAMAQNKIECIEWRVSAANQLYLPVFADKQSVDGKKFDHAALLESVQADDANLVKWQIVNLGSDSLIASVNGKDQLLQLAGFVKSDRWTKAFLNISTDAIFELYLDGNKIKNQGMSTDNPVKIDLTLGTGVHGLLLKLLSTGKTTHFGASITAENSKAILMWTVNPNRTVTIHDILEGESVGDARISASGKYILIQMNEVMPGSGKLQHSFRIYDIELSRNLISLRNNTLRAAWLPKTDKLFYQVEKEGKYDVYLYDVRTGEESLAASGLKSPQRISWSPNEDYFLFSHTLEAEKPGDLKRIFGNEDRIPDTRDRSYLYYVDLKTKRVRPLTAGSESADLHDIKPDGSRILFSTSRMDYSEVPFSKQNLYELDPFTMHIDTIWKDKLNSGSCQYSPDGTQLLVSGGPETFGELGVKVSQGRIPNSYDTQLFLFDLRTKKN